MVATIKNKQCWLSSHVKYRRFVDPSLDLTSTLCGLHVSIIMSHYFLYFLRLRVLFLQPWAGYITFTFAEMTTLSFSEGQPQHFLGTDDQKLISSSLCAAKLSVFTFAARNTLVHRSCWAGQAPNESQGWVNNQLPPLALSVATKKNLWTDFMGICLLWE